MSLMTPHLDASVIRDSLNFEVTVKVFPTRRIRSGESYGVLAAQYAIKPREANIRPSVFV
jgi:hypothetical protein